MFSYIWPIALVVISNIVYQICAKSAPKGMDPLASLTVTYLVGAVVSGALFFLLHRGGNLLREYRQLNWAPLVLGIVIVGLEVGFLYAYRAGWQISRASLVQSSILAVALVVVGTLLYRERVAWPKLGRVGICRVGLAFISMDNAER